MPKTKKMTKQEKAELKILKGFNTFYWVISDGDAPPPESLGEYIAQDEAESVIHFLEQVIQGNPNRY